MDYDDFEIELVAGDRGYELQVECSEGEDKVPVAWGAQSPNVTEIFSRFRGAAGSCTVKAHSTSPRGNGGNSIATDVNDLECIGRELFSLLFPTKVAILWHRCRARAAEQERGLRLRIHVDLRREEVAWFGILPWELLHDEDSGGFLALDGRTPVVRYLDMRRPRRGFPATRPLRVLVVMPEPYGAPRLDLERERESLFEAWGKDERVELVFPEMATFDGVRHAMAPGPIHAIHFMGHGVFDENAGEGGLFLEGPTGRRTPVLGRDVGKLVTGVEPPPALAILNGCETGRTGSSGERWPFAGAAAALMEAGMSAAVAMQLPIGDDEAIHFSRILYGALQNGHPVDGAVAEARLSLCQAYAAPVWAIPALFMRVRDGRLFDRRSHADSKASGSKGRPPAPADAIKSNIRITRELEDSEVRHVGYEGESRGDLRYPSTNVETTIGGVKRTRIEQVGVQNWKRR